MFILKKKRIFAKSKYKNIKYKNTVYVEVTLTGRRSNSPSIY